MHAYFDALVARSDYVQGWSLRPLAGHATITDPYYTSQLTDFLTTDSHSEGPTYDPVYDCCRYDIPCFYGTAEDPTNTKTLTAGISNTDTTLSLSGAGIYNTNHHVKIDDEIMDVTVDGGATLTVVRGQFGTTAVSHSSGAEVKFSVNGISSGPSWRKGLPTAGVTLPRVDGDRYAVVWDAYYDTSCLKIGLTSHKHVQLAVGGAIWWESRLRWQGDPLPNATFDANTHIASCDARCYNPASDITDFTSRVHVYPDRWTRWVVEILMSTTANSTLVNMWVGDKTQGMVRLYTDIPVTLSAAIDEFWLELNTSTDSAQTERIVDHAQADMVCRFRNMCILKPTDTSYRTAVVVPPVV